MADIPDNDFVDVMDEGKKYFLAHLGLVYSCTCEEWKNQTLDEKRRTCKHLRKYRGERQEQLRVDPLGDPPPLPEVRLRPAPQMPAGGVDAFEEAAFDEFAAEVSTWLNIVAYELNIKSALDKARQGEFATHFTGWSSIEEATMEATGTILDIKYLSDDSPPGMCTTCPLPEIILLSVFGTDKPTEKQLDEKAMHQITRLLLPEWIADVDPQEFCLQSYYVILYEKRGIALIPAKIAFAGWADDA